MARMLLLTAFIGGFATMALELTGGRLLAPLLGTSIIVWTSLIGVLLLHLSIGGILGGILADRFPTRRGIAIVLCGSALGIVGVLYAKSALPLLPVQSVSLVVLAPIVIFLLFAPAMIPLGVVSPYVAKVRMHQLKDAGRTVGLVSGIATLGSVLGTFFGGIWLPMWLGSTGTLMFLSGLLVLQGLLLLGPTRREAEAGVMIVLLWIPLFFMPSDISANGLTLREDAETAYGRSWVQDGTDSATGRPVRYLTNSVYGMQSMMYVDAPEELATGYLRAFDLANLAVLHPKKTLMIGGGGSTYPRHFLAQHATATMDVVEIDPGITDLARRFFGLIDDPRLRVYAEDGRTFVARSRETYDIVYVDAFLASLSIPFHLTTREALMSIAARLAPGGMVVTNIVSGIQGPRSDFLRAQLATYRAVFPHVAVLRVSPDNSPDSLQNIVLFSSREAPPENFLKTLGELTSMTLWTSPIPEDLPVLTDDRAPVEAYAATMVLE